MYFQTKNGHFEWMYYLTFYASSLKVTYIFTSWLISIFVIEGLRCRLRSDLIEFFIGYVVFSGIRRANSVQVSCVSELHYVVFLS